MKIVKAAAAKPSGLFLFYGQAKTRKTTTALCAPPELRPIGYFDADKGAYMRMRLLCMSAKRRKELGVVEKLPPEAGPWVQEDIDFIYPEEGTYYADCFEFATQHAKKYKLVVIDTLSVVGDKILREVVRTEYKNTNKPADQIRMKLTTPGNVTTEHPVLSDYGMAQDRVMAFIQALDSAGCHTLLISHEKTGEVKSGGAGRLIAGPRSVGNALLEQIPASCDLALRFEPRATKIGEPPNVVIRSMNHGGMFIAGDRSGMFPDGHPLDPIDVWKRMKGTIGLGQGG